MKSIICTLLGCVTLVAITWGVLYVWEDEGERWRALERTKYILDHQLQKPNVDRPSIEIPTEQDT